MASVDGLLTVSISENDPSVVIADGQIDSHTSPALDDALAGLPASGAVSVDLADISFIDSSGLRVIVRAHKRHVESGGSLTILRPSDPVRRLLEITGLSSQLDVAE